MESQVADSHGQGHEKEPHIVGHQMEGGDEHHHEKKSVLKKVRAKAKKIKDALIKHGHDHDHDHDHEEEEDDDDEEEEIYDDPEIHGAPIIKSAGTVDASGQSGMNAGRRTKVMEADPLHPERTGKPGDTSHVHQKEERMGQPALNFGFKSVIDEIPKAPQNTPTSHSGTATGTEARRGRDQDPSKAFVPGRDEHLGQPKLDLQRPKGGLEEDPSAPKDTPGAYTPSNYESKVTDPTGKGGKEAGIISVLDSFDKMRIYDESKPNTGQEQNVPTTGTEDFYTSLPTGSHDQFSPELAPPITVTEEKEHPHENTGAGREAGDKGGNSSMTESAVDYGKKIALTVIEKLTPVYEKIAGAGSSVVTKMPGISTGTGSEREQGVVGQEKGVSVKDYFAEKLRPGEEDKALSEVISEAWHKKKAEQESKSKSASTRPVTEAISDALHKQKEEEPDDDPTTERPMGKVTESEEVARRLGTTEHHGSSEERTNSSIVNDSGNGMVHRIKGAVGSWFSGKGAEMPETQQPDGASVGSAFGDTNATGERRLQESGN